MTTPKATPLADAGGVADALTVILRALVDQPEAPALLLQVGGVCVVGQVASAARWLKRVPAPAVVQALGELAEFKIDHTPSTARLTYLRERLRWGSGLTPAQMDELRAFEASRQAPTSVYLAPATVYAGSQAVPVAAWTGRLDQVSAFALLTAPETA